MNTIITYKGKNLTMNTFMSRFACETEAEAIRLAGLLVKQGKASIDRKLTEEEEIVERAIKNQNHIDLADELDAEYTASAIRNREVRNEDVDLLSFTLDFNTTINAMGFEDWIYQAIGPDVEVSMKTKRGAISLEIENVSALECAKITNRYKTDRTVGAVVNATDKGLNAVTGAVNYTATNVIAPVATMAGRGVMNIGKGLATTLIKTGTGLLNSGAQAVRETKVALDTDEEMIRAKRELTSTKNSLASFTRNKLDKRNRAGGSGITFK